MFVMNLCEALSAAGGRWRGIAGVFFNLGEIGRQIRERGLPVVGPFNDRIIHEEFIEALHAECQRLKPAAVVANLGGEAFDFMRFVPDSVLRVAVIHSDEEYVYRLVERYLPWIDLVVGVSARNCEVMQSRLAARHVPIKQVACGVPMAAPVKREIRKEGPLRILYLGRVIELQKRASLLVEVIRKTLELKLPVAWTIAGDGPDMDKLRDAFSENRDQVVLTGSVEYAQVPALLAEHDVYFLCSDYEGLPLSMLEAMGAGCVPVVSDLPSGISEVVNDANGIRVPVLGPDGYVAALGNLCDNRERVASMAVAAAQAVRENYSTLAMARRWNQVLEEHAKTTEPEWSQPCTADIPPECRTRWHFHPRLRPARRLLKICSQHLQRNKKP